LIARPSLSKRPPLWLTSARENGEIFHLELPAGLETKLLRLSSGDGGSVSSLALGIGCNSEDTGYSSDQDLNTSEHSCMNVFKPEAVIKNEFSNIHHPKSGNTRYNSPRISLSSVSSVFSHSEAHEKGRHQDFFSSKRKAFDSSVKSLSNEEACDDGIFLNKSDLRSSKTSSISTNSRSSFGINNFNDGKLLPRPELTRNSKLKSKPSGGLSLSTKKRHDSFIDWKTVNVDVKVNALKSREPLQSCHSATGAVLCEQILGIIPTCNEDSHIMGRNQSPEVIVKALTSDCDSALSSEAIVGSWLHSINGQELTWYNMDTLLSSLCKLRKVRLTLKSLKPENSTVDFEGLVHILTSDSHDQLVLDNMAAMYISLEGVSPDDPTNTKDGLAYSFPSEKNCLHQLQGMFYTLAHLIKDINKTNSIKNTVLMVDKQRMNVAYLQECSDILVFAMPASIISISQLNTLLNEYARFFRLLFGTLESVFCNKSHTAFLDAVLTYLFRQVLQATLSSASLSAGSVFKQKLSVEASPFIRHSQHVPSLGLTDDLSIVFEKIMNEFESSDFANMSECYYGCRRQYNILGSAYIYSGHLVCSHLSPQDLRDVYVYLQHLGILDVTSRSSVAHFVAWREVYPTRFCSDIAEINNSFGYSEPNSRWCLLVVGLKHGLFCCLLETIKLSTLNPTPLTADVFYVEQAKACLLQLQAPQLLTELNLRVSKESQSDFTKSDYCATYVHTNGEKTAQLFIDNQKQRSPSSSFMLSMHSDWRSHVDNPSLINSFKTPDSSFKQLNILSVMQELV
ncbi:protein inturned-like, partial [Physella acuta]|uniref:protein inturned-like n=1 Tax=Physella acuta TaxID=109671 RepID=UPI0027DDA573